jgi:hypothetical protein
MILKNNKGQVTLFIIIAIVLIIGVALALIIPGVLKKGNTAAPEKISDLQTIGQNVNIFIDQCFDKTSKDSLYRLGLRGGYITSDVLSLSTEYDDVAYAAVNGQNRFVTVAQMEKELKDYNDKSLSSCFDNFSQFKDLGYDIQVSSIDTTVKINNDNVIFNLEAPTDIVKGNDKISLVKFSKKIPVRLGIIYSKAKEIVSYKLANPERTNLNMMVDKDMVILLQTYDDDLLYSIYDNKSFVEESEQFVFLFALKNNRTANANVPVIEKINDISLNVGTPLSLNVIASDPDGGRLYYDSDSTLFSIDHDNGQISYIPQQWDIGNHSITLSVTNGNKTAYENFEVNVLGEVEHPKYEDVAEDIFGYY